MSKGRFRNLDNLFDVAVNTTAYWSKTDDSGGPTACWPWIGPKHVQNYGFIGARRYADDKRVMLVQLSQGGTRMTNAIIASMNDIEAELARRIGRNKLDTLVDLLAMDWGPAEINRAQRTTSASMPTTRRRAK